MSSALELRTRKAPQDEPGTIPADLQPMERTGTEYGFLPYLELFWAHRQVLLRAGLCAILASVLIALLIPVRYMAVTRLMPPDTQSSSSLGLLAAMSGRSGSQCVRRASRRFIGR